MIAGVRFAQFVMPRSHYRLILSVDEAFFLIIMPRSHYRLILSSRLTSMGPTSVASAEIDWLSMEPLLWPPIRRRTRLK